MSGPAASGGDVVVEYVVSGVNYRAHIFQGSGALTVHRPINAEYLVVAGGGGGAGVIGSGGGAGGLLTNVGGTPLVVAAGSYSVVVGAGGAGGTTAGGSKGANSTALGLTAFGGGANTGAPDNDGGSGAGGWVASVQPPGVGVAGQGYNGGAGVLIGNISGGGGGGAGGIGADAQLDGSGSGAIGGIGVESAITGTPTWYAGGGGGGASPAGFGSIDGTQGRTIGGASAAANTGSGGGGAVNGETGLGGAGGSGIVVVRYEVTVGVSLPDGLGGAAGKRLEFVVTVEGWPYALWSAATGFALAGGQAPLYGIIDEDGVQESPTSLDYGQRLQVGGGITLRLRDHARQLRPLVAPRAQRTTFLAAPVTKADASVAVKNAAALPSAGVVYVGAETIAYGGKTGNTLTSCARGAFGSEAKAANGGTEQGRSVYLSPPTWSGRRLTLQVYLVSEYGQPLPDSLTTVGVFRLEGAPADVGDGAWEIQGGHLLSELAGLKLGRGVREYETRGPMILETASGQSLWRLRLGVDPTPFTLGDAPIFSHVVVRLQGAWDGVEPTSVFRVFDLPLLDDLRLYEQPLTTRNGQPFSLSDIINEAELQGGVVARAIKPIVVLAGGPAYLLTLYALASRLGDGDNGSLDVLPGAPAADFGAPTFAFGAGIRAAELDADTFAAVGETVRPGWSWVIDEELPALDMLRDFLRAADAFACYSLDGKLQARKMGRDRRAIEATLTRADFIDGEVATEYREDLVAPRIRLEASHDPVVGEARAVINVAEEELVELYPHQQEQLVVVDRSIAVRPINDADPGAFIRPTSSFDEAATLLRREQNAHRRGRLVVSGVLPPPFVLLEVGAHVSLSLPDVPDYRGGTLTSATGRIVGRGPQWESGGHVAVQIEVLSADFYLAPSSRIASLTGAGPWVLTLETADDATGTTTPGNLWRAGDDVVALTPASGTLLTFAVESVTPTTITVSGSSAPSAGQIVSLVDHGGTATGLSADGLSRDQLAFLQGDDEGASSFVSRWT